MINRYDVKEISSTWSDQNKFETYLKYELALMKSLEAHGLCEKGTSEKISKKVTVNSTRITEIEREIKHDVIAFCSSITEQLTEKEARFFHYGVTSSDVIDSSINILIKQSLDIIIKDYKKFILVLRSFAEKHKHTLCMGRSHGINAEPLSLGGKFLGFYCEFYRRYNELKSYAENEITIQCSGAVGNYTVVSTEIEDTLSKILGLPVEPLSTQIIPRDRMIKMMSIISGYSAAMDRFCIELRHLQHSNIGEISEGFGHKQKGSSTMPHKKNPISAENLSGISRLLKSYYQVSIENNNLWHERDISHSSSERFILPDSLGLMAYSIRRLTKTVEGLVVHNQIIKDNIPSNQVYLSSYILHKLIQQSSVRREELYNIIQKASFNSMNTKQSFIELVDKELKDHKIDVNLSKILDQHVDSLNIFTKGINNTFKRVDSIYQA